MLSKLNIAVATISTLAEAVNLPSQTVSTDEGGNNVTIDINFCFGVGDDANCPSDDEA